MSPDSGQTPAPGRWSHTANPRVIAGPGALAEAARAACDMGSSILVVHGLSFEANGGLERLTELLSDGGAEAFSLVVQGEPGPELVDMAVERHRKEMVHAVIAVGGGSALDTGKAVSALIPERGTAEDYLEGLGKKKLSGYKVPFIAVPTTAGTGSEATKNAVLSKVGRDGYKRSLRHDSLVPDLAVLDPELCISTPVEVTIAGGLDALTQLLEAYLSKNATPFTDRDALTGLEYFARGYEKCIADGTDINARQDMLTAAYLSGSALANAGLGVVHGIAGALGGWYEIPHGVICGTLVGASLDSLHAKLQKQSAVKPLEKMRRAAVILTGKSSSTPHDLCGHVKSLVERYGLPRLSEAGVKEQDLDRLSAMDLSKQSPLPFSAGELRSLLSERF